MGESLMKKYGIKSKDNNDILIFHALPNETTKFQWYISENINEKGQPIDGQIYESYTLSTEVIKRKSFEGKSHIYSWTYRSKQLL